MLSTIMLLEENKSEYNEQLNTDAICEPRNWIPSKMFYYYHYYKMIHQLNTSYWQMI